MRRLCVLLLALTLLTAACSSVPAEYPRPYSASGVGGVLDLTGLALVADNGRYQLWADMDNVCFEIRENGTGAVWKSRPDHAADPVWVQDILQGNVSALIMVTVLDDKNAPHVLSSGEASVSCRSLPDGIRFSFRFERQRLTVPLDIVLTGDGFTATVPPGDVREEGFLLNSVTVLPYFNSGSPDDDGFLFYPDGSGAISEYGKNYNNTPDVTQPVYGFDRGVGVIEAVSEAQGYRMPVFGVKTNQTAYLAVIEGPSAFISSIQTGVARDNNRYFKNTAVFTYRDVGKVTIRDNVSTVNTAYTIPAGVAATAAMTVRYLLLCRDGIDYGDMALMYRDYLEREGVFSERTGFSGEFHLTLNGALVKPSSFLGIPMERKITLTTFKQAGEIIDILHDAGIGTISVLYKGAQKNGYNSQWTRDFTFNGSLGGKKGWEAFTGAYGGEDTVFLNGELMQVYKTGKGFSVSRDAARTTGNGINFQYSYYLLDGTRSTERQWYLLAPELWGGAFGRFRESVSPYASNLAIEDAGSLVYSEYEQKSPLYRDITGPMLTQALKDAASPAGRLALSGGYAYTWGIADMLYGVPLGASNYFIQSAEVPFYQMIVHGYIEYSGPPANLSPDKQRSFLRQLEYGALPHYYGIYAPSSDLNRSTLAGMFSANYLDWLPDAAAQAAQAGDLYRKIAGQRMVEHSKLGEGVFMTQYENGVAVTVDYNALTFSVTQFTVVSHEVEVAG